MTGEQIGIRGDDASGDLLIPEGSYALFQGLTTGAISTKVGPANVSQSGQEQAVKFDPKRREFVNSNRKESVQLNIRADETSYVILENPCLSTLGTGEENNKLIFPSPTSDKVPSNGLAMGRKVVIHGPIEFALWPGQSAEVVPGHALRSNEYLELVVYDADEARANWASASVVAAQTSSDDKKDDAEGTKVTASAPDLVMGQRLIIKGTEVSFYRPPTGIQVVPNGESVFTRQAVSLELLEYCILIDEDGNKRYEEGPAVVFPNPSERFDQDTKDNRKFRAIELQEQAGLHLKALKDFKDNNGKDRKAGDEYFVTGKDRPIYYPCEEAIVPYSDGERVHYAIAIPKGEGRYVMDKNTGDIETVIGPRMLLCDPTKKVIVRRILTDRQSEDWYPGNADSITYNRGLRSVQQATGSARGDVVDDYVTRQAVSKGLCSMAREEPRIGAARSVEFDVAFEEEPVGSAMMEEFDRRSNFTQPKSITLDTKFEGVPGVELWTGYAVMIVDREGNRRIVSGPSNTLLNYDESLEIMELSTGKPKSTDKLIRTVYLRVSNNKVSDIINVETSDHVQVEIKLLFLVNFEESNPNLDQDSLNYQERWFSSENYVKLLCDHIRSILKGEIRKHSINSFYSNSTAVIRDIILGNRPDDGGRPGMFFDQNGMHIIDVEVLEAKILDHEISNLLTSSQREAVESGIRIQSARRSLDATKEMEKMHQDEATAKEETKQHDHTLTLAEFKRELDRSLDKIKSDFAVEEKRKSVLEVIEANEDLKKNAELARERAEADQELELKKVDQEIELEKLKAEVEAVKERFGAIDDSNLTEMLAILSREDMLSRVATACSWQTVIGGTSLEDALNSIFGMDSPIAKALATLKAGGSLAPKVLGVAVGAGRET